ncbi:ATP-binding protein [Variovorax sp. PCZ-1]|uniref:sensor histidine kinase n=1 Tax=Variovorax sp. PCZ-1 TaxID=2835533 RepID=UPI001BCFBB1F|nr:ATP-binding protein [Variovorax sp. PCZ-1]MBS7807940.1 histidine kinase [Variovorax sp. PCZ-1]
MNFAKIMVALVSCMLLGFPCAQAQSTHTELLTQAQISWAQQDDAPTVFEAGSVSLPHEWAGTRPAHAGVVWYRLSFERPETDLPAVYLERVCTNAQVWVNGTLLGTGGRMQTPLTRNCYFPMLFNIPASLLKPGTNVLVIKVAGYAALETAARQRQAGLSVVRIGSEAQLRTLYEQRYFRNITVAQIISGSVVLFGLISLAIFAVRRQDLQYLFFGLGQISWALITSRIFIRDIPLSGFHSEVLITSLFPPAVSFFVMFILHNVGRPVRWMGFASLVFCVVWPVCMLLAGPAHLFRLASICFALIAAYFVAVFLFSTWFAWRSKRAEFYMMIGVLLLVSLMVSVEISIQFGLLPQPRVHLIHFTLPLVFFAIFVRLALQFAQALTRSERMTHELEQRVVEKTREIESSYEKLSSLRTVQVIEQERQRIAADLHDDLGAKLLSITKTPQGTHAAHTAHLAREALDDMRLSVRGLTAQPSPAQDVLADWRLETMQRLEQAGLQGHWQCNEPPVDLVLRARMQVQLTRVLRESVSNVIRHAQAKQCWIHIDISSSTLSMSIEDDGKGIAKEELGTRGHGLINIERRAHHLHGEYDIGRSEWGGARIWVKVPIEESSSTPAPLTESL